MSGVLPICLQTWSSQLIPLLFLGSARAANMSSINWFEFLNCLLVHWFLKGTIHPSVDCLHSPLCGNKARQVSLSVLAFPESLLRESVHSPVNAAIHGALMIASYGNSTAALT